MCSLKRLPERDDLQLFFFSGFTEVVCVYTHYRSVSGCVYSTIVHNIIFIQDTLLHVCTLLLFVALLKGA